MLTTVLQHTATLDPEEARLVIIATTTALAGMLVALIPIIGKLVRIIGSTAAPLIAEHDGKGDAHAKRFGDLGTSIAVLHQRIDGLQRQLDTAFALLRDRE